LEKRDLELEILDLSSFERFPAQEIFEHLGGLVIRLVEGDLSGSRLNSEEAEFWTDFLASHGSLVLVADDLGPREVWDSQLPSYVGFKGSKSTLNTEFLEGRSHDLISDQLNLGVGLSGARDLIRPLDGSGIDVVYQTQSGEVLGIKQQSCAFRMSYFSFLPEEIKDPQIRCQFYDRVIDWHLGYAVGEGMQAPEFPVIELSGDTKGIYNIWSEVPDSIIVLEFFATWCSSCSIQLPRMFSLRNKFRDQKVFFHFVSYKETIAKVEDYLQNHPQIDWKVNTTRNGLGAKKYGLKVLPGIYLIDRQRKILEIHQGLVEEAALEREINALLSKN